MLVSTSTTVPGTSTSPDGKQLATGTQSSIRLWNTVTSKLEREFVIARPQPGFEDLGEIFTVAYTPDGKSLAVASSRVSFWDFANGKYLFDEPQDGLMHSLLFSPDGKTLLSGTRFFDLERV